MCRLLLFICLSLFAACKKNCSDYYWVGTHGQFRSDTCNFCQKITVHNDSFILDCNTGNSFSRLFIFDLKDKSKAYCSGGIDSKDLILDGKIISAGSKVIFKYIADTVIAISGTSYRIYKYLYDKANSVDAGCNYYWAPDFGIVYFESTAWNSYYRLYTRQKETDGKIAFMVDVIKHWKIK